MTWTQEEQAGEWRENRRVRLLKRTLHRAKPYTNRWRAVAHHRAGNRDQSLRLRGIPGSPESGLAIWRRRPEIERSRV